MIGRSRSAGRRSPLRGAAALAVLTSLLLGLVGASPVRAIGLSWTVDSTADAPDAATGNILCRTLVGTCTLRAAVMQANAIDPGPGNHHTIIVPAGTITMIVMGDGEDNAATGDYDVKRSVTIRGAGAGETIIQGSTTTAEDAFDRIFDLQTLGIDFVLEDLTVRRGNAVNVAGGAIRVNSAGANITLDHVTLTQNRSFDQVGAAIAARGGVLTIRDSRISRNDAPDGPVVDVDGGSLSVTRSTFANNVAWDSAITVHGDGVGLIDRTTFNGQQATGATAIALRVGHDSTDTSEVTVRNSTFSGNKGPAGAVVIVGARNVALHVLSSTIAGNTGYGISGASGTRIENTLMAGNSSGNCDVDRPSSLGHNLDTGHTCGLDGPGDISGGVGDLGALADNGGPTRTRALGPKSDAIDAGSGCPSIDQRGAARPKDGDGDGQKRCDIGAYEAAAGTVPTPAPTPKPTPKPTPTAPPTASPTAAPTTAPTASPPATPAAPTQPASTSQPSALASPDPEASATPAPAATAAPNPTEDVPGDATLWVVLLIVAAAVALGVFLGLRRRRARSQAPGGGA